MFIKEIKDPKGFIIKSQKTHILYNGNIYKLIKFKKYFNGSEVTYTCFFKINGKLFQRTVREKFIGIPLEIFKYTLNKRILAFSNINKIAIRYMNRYFPEMLLI